MIYVDASVLVSALTAEEGTGTARAWLGRQPALALCGSGWLSVEFSSALGLKVRRGELSAEFRRESLAAWHDLRTEVFVHVPVPDGAFAEAARLIDEPASALRTGDALHLAIASLGGHRLATLDHRLGEAARGAGVAVEVLG